MMNRHERRKLRAQLMKMPLPPARQDGRPLFYDIGGTDRVMCHDCIKAGVGGMEYRRGEAFMNDPANSPTGERDIHTICKHHLPDNAVIYDATTNMCRNKAGDNSWMEDAPDPDASFKRKG